MAALTRFRRDPSWRQPGDGRVVIAGSPLRLFRVSRGGAMVLDAARTGEQPDTAIVAKLLDRFVDAGALHPEPDAGPFTADDVTVVIPVLGAAPPLPPGVRTIVVDDGSTPPVVAPGAQMLRLPTNRGPAAARNAGLAVVQTPLVAFLDADVVVTDGWLTPLLAQFADPRVVLVAPRVASLPGDGALVGYEQRHSPLDLGDQPARIAAGTRVSYVPAAAMVCRVDAVRAAGGFDESMRVGEDVDLVWRLVGAGHRCRYEPSATVHHRPRPTLGAMVRQRVGYGRSAAPLAGRHPGALAPARMSGWSLAVWLLLALRRPLLAVSVAAGTTVALQRKLGDVPRAESARLALLGHLAAGGQLATATRRVWWPAAAAIALVWRRARPTVAAAYLLPMVADAVRTRSPRPVADAPLRWLDESAYGAGVWIGVAETGDAGPLLPGVSGWPQRGDG
jgi:mycofactocin system glycosyltransferase